MVDRVTEIVPKQSIRGYKLVSNNEPWTQGHFPGRPIMPGVLIIEALAQIGGIPAYASELFDASRSQMYFLGIDKAKFRHTGLARRSTRALRRGDPAPIERVEATRRSHRGRHAVCFW